MEQAIGLRFLVDVGTLNPKQLPRVLATLLMLQADGRLCRFALDHESLQLRLDAGVYIGIDVDPTSILRSVLNDLRSMLSEDRLLACVGNLPDRRFSEREV